MIIFLLLWVDLHLFQSAGAIIQLSSDVTFGSSKLVCPVNEVTFSCTAVDVTVLEWRRNGNQIASPFLPTSNEGIIDDVKIPDGFEIVLDRVMREGTSILANFSTTLTANFSVLVNGSDQISCVSLDTVQTIDILYDRKRTLSPAPLFSHSFSSLRDGEVSLTLTWDETFTTTHAVQMYCVRSDLCPGEPCVKSDTPFSCPGLVAGGEYMFWVTAVNCGNQRGEESQSLTTDVMLPPLPTGISVKATYSNSLMLTHIMVLWEPVDPISFTDTYIAMHYYRVYLSNRHEELQMKNGDCNETICSAFFSVNPIELLLDNSLNVRLSTVNLVGESERIQPGFRIDSSAMVTNIVSYKNCTIFGRCKAPAQFRNLTSSDLDCTMQLGTDLTYNMFYETVEIPENETVQLSEREAHSIYFYVVSFNVKSNFIVSVQGVLTISKSACQLNTDLPTVKPEALVIALITVATCLIAAVCGLIIGIFIFCKTRNKFKLASKLNIVSTKSKASTELLAMPVSIPEHIPSAEHNEEADHEYEDIPTEHNSDNTCTTIEAAETTDMKTSETIVLEENVAYQLQENRRIHKS